MGDNTTNWLILGLALGGIGVAVLFLFLRSGRQGFGAVETTYEYDEAGRTTRRRIEVLPTYVEART